MSVACGTLSASFGLPIDYASSGGQMNDFPSNRPTGQVPEELWNVDSNITIWKQHKVRKTAAKLAHAVHRHDQIRRLKLPGSERPSNSGMLSADSCFLEAWGYPLGLRDRQGRPCSMLRPVNLRRGFRSVQNFYETSVEGLYPSGHKNFPVHRPYDQFGKPFASTLRRGWEGWEHVAKREAAKMSQGVHSHSTRGLKSTCYPQTNCEVNPAAIYTLKYRKFGEEEAMQRYPGKTALPRLGRRDDRTLQALRSLSGGRVSSDGDGELTVHRTPVQSSTAPLNKGKWWNGGWIFFVGFNRVCLNLWSMQSIVDYFDVRKEFVSYLVYHRNPLNRLIHMVTEPVLYICLLFLANNFLPPLDGTGVNFAVIINLVYMISYIFMEIPAGILFMPFMGVMYYVAVYILHKEQWMWVILIQFGCFALLLLSHHFLEKKTPPFQPFLLQGFHAALFFVWLDLLFQFGYKRHLHDEIDALVTSELKKTQ